MSAQALINIGSQPLETLLFGRRLFKLGCSSDWRSSDSTSRCATSVWTIQAKATIELNKQLGREEGTEAWKATHPDFACL